jgi:hypothetical protein
MRQHRRLYSRNSGNPSTIALQTKVASHFQHISSVSSITTASHESLVRCLHANLTTTNSASAVTPVTCFHYETTRNLRFLKVQEWQPHIQKRWSFEAPWGMWSVCYLVRPDAVIRRAVKAAAMIYSDDASTVESS